PLPSPEDCQKIPHQPPAAFECKPPQVIDDKGCFGAGNETRTRDLNLGKVALYQLSYSRPKQTRNCRAEPPGVKNKSDKNAAKALNGPVISLGGDPLGVTRPGAESALGRRWGCRVAHLI